MQNDYKRSVFFLKCILKTHKLHISARNSLLWNQTILCEKTTTGTQFTHYSLILEA
jgi:hypothetical protein